MRPLVCVSWVLQSRQIRNPKRRMSLGQALQLVSGPGRSIAITATMASRPVQHTARTLRLHTHPLGSQVSQWRTRTLKVRPLLSSRLALTALRTSEPLRSTLVCRTQVHSGVAHRTLAQMQASLGIKAHSRMTCRKASTKRCLSRTRKFLTSSSQRLVRMRKHTRNSLTGHPTPGNSSSRNISSSSNTSSRHSNRSNSNRSNSNRSNSNRNSKALLLVNRPPISDLHKTSLRGVRCRRIHLSSCSSKTTRSDSCPARTLVEHPAPWSTLFLAVGRVRISILRARPLFQDLPQTIRRFHRSHPKDRLLLPATPFLKACRIQWRGRCLRSLKALLMDRLIMACMALVDLVCQPNLLRTLCLSLSSQGSLRQMSLFLPSLCRVIRCSSSTHGNLPQTCTRCRRRTPA
jgi:hypothetical protein